MRKTTFILLALLLLVYNQKGSAENQLSINDDSNRINFLHKSSQRQVHINDAKIINALQEVFSSATEVMGFSMMADPEYVVDVVDSNNEQIRFQLWIGDKGQESTIKEEDGDRAVYTIPPEGTNRLIHLVERIFNEDASNE